MLRAVAVRNVIFDIGGVLLDWDPRHLYRQLIDDPEELEWFLANVCTMEWNAGIDSGRPFDDACDELAGRHPQHAELIQAWKRQDEMVAGEMPGTADIVVRLRAEGTRTYLLTNMPSEVFAARLARYDILKGFDGSIVSGHEGVLKPSQEIFRLLTERYRIDPSESLFIDDSPANVEGARAAGLQAHHFVDAPSLEAELASVGLLRR
jgi:2-haloacid dehalogenase